MNNDVIIKIGGTAGAGKSTVAFILEQALTEAGIDYKYEEDDLEIQDRSESFITNTIMNLKLDKVKDFGITANIKTCQLNRECYGKDIKEVMKKF